MKNVFRTTAIIFFVFFAKAWAQIPTDGLIAEYLFNGNCNESMGVLNGTEFGSPMLIDGIAGSSDQAYYFDGADDHFELPSGILPVSFNSYTISVWIKPDTTGYTSTVRTSHFFDLSGDRQTIFKYMDYGSSPDNFTNVVLVYNKSDQPYYNNWGENSDGTKVYIDPEKWTHIIFGVSNDSVQFYINGNFVGRTTLGYPSFASSTLNLIGCGIDNSVKYNFYKGAVDQIRVYNRSLTESEITSLFEEHSISTETTVWDKAPNNDISYTAGNVKIGKGEEERNLFVNGKIETNEIKVSTDNFPDYVFEKSYKLKSIEEVQDFINKNGHLPEVPKAEEAEVEGIYLGEMNKLLLKKIEELTLYIIQQQETIEKLKNRIGK